MERLLDLFIRLSLVERTAVTSILLLAALIGPLPEQHPSLRLRIHTSGESRESLIIRSELSREDPWFGVRRWAIGQHYRVELIDDQYNLRPTWQIGTLGDRREFAPSTFAGSGSFIRSLEYIASNDQWERELVAIWKPGHDGTVVWNGGAEERHREAKPKPFPPPLQPPNEFWDVR